MLTLRFDGSSKGNPGRGGSGAVLFEGSTVVFETFQPLEFVTNNQAEYVGLIIGLQECIKRQIDDIMIEGDSMLVVNQVNSIWKVKEPTLAKLHLKVMTLLRQFKCWKIQHIPRSLNKHADRLSNY